MRFITGPRQCGKTTLAREKLAAEKSPQLYYLWDLRTVRDRYKKNPLFFSDDRPPAGAKGWVCFDEIHKYPRWKNVLKGIFDSAEDHYQFIVTGSAKFDIFRKAGDSLSGRYFTFHLFPLGFWEVSGTSSQAAQSPRRADDFLKARLDSREGSQDALRQLLQWSGFPEPFLHQSEAFHAKWREDYIDTVIKEDIGALTRIIDKEHLHDLYRLLPQMVGSPLSESSLGSHLEISNPTIKNYLKRLEDFYLSFKIHPYTKNIKRALLKAPKAYLFDWTLIDDPGFRFENFLAVQLKALLQLWSENSADRYVLFYIRTREKEETDFLIIQNKKPWMMVEAKRSQGRVDAHHFKLQAALGGIPMVQLCEEGGVARIEGKNAYQMSAGRFLSV